MKRILGFLTGLALAGPLLATPANKKALGRFFEHFLPARLNQCATCHLPSDNPEPRSLEEFPHNAFGKRLRALREKGVAKSLADRLRLVAGEDADGDGVANEVELLSGGNPGDARDKPAKVDAATVVRFQKFLAQQYRWRPFAPVSRPKPPTVKADWARNPIDAFVAARHSSRGLTARPDAGKAIWLRRVSLDLTGLSPTRAELRDFLADASPSAHEKVVDQLLASPRYGERWGRHWMDVWRYSDWAGYKASVRDSQPHIWRWRDWIVESLNAGKGYDRMVREMLAADELEPTDAQALRATGFLARNFKSTREKWMEDVVAHTAQAFLGLTLQCAKCHDHKYDEISQVEYFRFRAIFETHHVRTDRVPGQPDTTKAGLVRAFDNNLKAATFFYERGDERRADKQRRLQPGIPSLLGGEFKARPVALPVLARQPAKRPFVIEETLAAAETKVAKAKDEPKRVAEAELAALRAVLAVEKLEDGGQQDSAEWKQAATTAVKAQRQAAMLRSRVGLASAEKALAAAKQKHEVAKAEAKKKTKAAASTAEMKLTAARKALDAAKKAQQATPDTKYKPRVTTSHPAQSSGRRAALTRWLTDRRNPLTARVAVNHIWARHFGRGLVASMNDLGANGKEPTHPALLDWLAAEFMAAGWDMKAMHRLIVLSGTYRMASTPAAAALKTDPDNVWLWRMPYRRMEAELVRDNLLHVSGRLDPRLGGPDIPHTDGQASRRRSIYLRHAHEKLAPFLRIFDCAPVTECYLRKQSVVPHQALALANSRLTFEAARALTGKLAGNDGEFITAAFEQVLARGSSKEERALCLEFLRRQRANAAHLKDPGQRARENLVMSLFNHNDFVTIR